METVVVRVPPWEVLQDMFPESSPRAIINGETIKGTIDHYAFWTAHTEAKLNSDRIIVCSASSNPQLMNIDALDTSTYTVFIDWLVKLDWKPYGEQKILKRRSDLHVHSHYPDL